VPRDGARPDAEKIGLNRGRRSVAVDLKAPGATDLILRLADRSDVLLEGFRPGVAERLGIGPETCTERNPRLVYGRMTGWGQDGAWRDHAGHDINFVATSGVLHGIGARGGPPVPPLSLVGDFGGGGLMLAFGVVCALREAASSGHGQIVDAAMVDGSALLATLFYIMRQEGSWSDERAPTCSMAGHPFTVSTRPPTIAGSRSARSSRSSTRTCWPPSSSTTSSSSASTTARTGRGHGRSWPECSGTAPATPGRACWTRPRPA